MNQTPESAMPEVETFALCPSNPNLLCLGRNTGRIETWDITAKCIRNVEQLRGAIIKMLFPRMSKEPMCLATTSAGIVFCFDALTGTVLRSFRGHEGPVFDIALASDDSFFVTCGEDSTVKVFSLSWNLLSLFFNDCFLIYCLSGAFNKFYSVFTVFKLMILIWFFFELTNHMLKCQWTYWRHLESSSVFFCSVSVFQLKS